MTQSPNSRFANLILGALVADAASMGLHWIYDQNHIRKIAPTNPEFREPSAKDYAGVPAYFAHAGRMKGAQSQYGEQTLVMLRSLVETGGRFNLNHYAAAFQSHFGYGGTFVGYIDHATRDTLDNLRRAEERAHETAKTIPFDGDPAVCNAMVIKALSILKQNDPATQDARFEEAVRVTHDNDVIVAYGLKILRSIQLSEMPSGSQDVQLPAIAKLPALIAALVHQGIADGDCAQIIETAIRATNNNETAVNYGTTGAHMMRAAAVGGDVDAILQAAHDGATPDIRADLGTAVQMSDRSLNDVTTHFGLACNLSYAIPSISHNFKTASSYSEAVTRNIYAGGDTCGRAILLGAVMGAVHGVGGDTGIPQNWIDQLGCAAELRDLTDRLFG